MGPSSPGAIPPVDDPHCMTVRAFLALDPQDPRRAVELMRAAERAVRSLGHETRRGIDWATAEDLVAEAVLRTVADPCAALARVRDPTVPLSGWLRGVALVLHRRVPRLRSDASASPDDIPAIESRDESGAIPGTADVDLSYCTCDQRAVLERALSGQCTAEIARELGVSRAAVRERLQRGIRRTRERTTWEPIAREWAVRAAEFADAHGRTIDAGLLREYAEGRAHAESATLHGITRQAVAQRLKRLRAAFGRGDTSPPRC